jgi:hypothetical protein
MMPWICGGNFTEAEWLHHNVLNKGIERLEEVGKVFQNHEGKDLSLHFHIKPIGDLAYQSKAKGHQGCAATHFSVYWTNITRKNAGANRETLQKRSMEFMKTKAEEVLTKEKELEEDVSLSKEARKNRLQEFIAAECNNQKELPMLMICERFTPDGALHGKCSATQALTLTMLEAIWSNNEMGVLVLEEVISRCKRTGGLSGFGVTIDKKYIEADSKYQFRLIGDQASKILQCYHSLIVDSVRSVFATEKKTVTLLLELKLKAFSFICTRLRLMSSSWEVLRYVDESGKEKDEEEVREYLDLMTAYGSQIIKLFPLFFPESNLTPWLYTLCLDCPYFTKQLYEELGSVFIIMYIFFYYQTHFAKSKSALR